MAEPMPTARRRQLLRELRRLRNESGMTITDAGGVIGKSEAAYYRLESGRVGRVKELEVKALCTAFQADTETTERLVVLAAESRPVRGWWGKDAGAPKWFETYMGLEAAASELSMWQPMIVPGLLQTPAYARQVILDPSEIERRVQLRMTRQEILDRDSSPRLWVVLDEAVLHRRIGGPEVMRGQLDHLVACSERPNITIQVFPFSAGSHLALVGGPVVILGFPDPADPGMVYLESQTGATYVEEPPEIGRYADILNHLRAASLSATESRDRIAAAGVKLYETN